MCIFFIYFYFYFVLSWFFLSNTLDIHRTNYGGKLYTLAAYLTQRKLNTQQIIAYPLEKQDKIPKNKPRKSLIWITNKSKYWKLRLKVILASTYFKKFVNQDQVLKLNSRLSFYYHFPAAESNAAHKAFLLWHHH